MSTTTNAPTKRTLWQYGYRINETGKEQWFRVDLQYDGANSARREQVVTKAESIVAAAAEAGVTLTYTLLRRGHLTTTWSRWLAVEEVR